MRLLRRCRASTPMRTMSSAACARILASCSQQMTRPGVRAAVTGGAGKASDGLTIAQIKEALAAKKIDIPAGVTRNDDLAALLDGAP